MRIIEGALLGCLLICSIYLEAEAAMNVRVIPNAANTGATKIWLSVLIEYTGGSCPPLGAYTYAVEINGATTFTDNIAWGKSTTIGKTTTSQSDLGTTCKAHTYLYYDFFNGYKSVFVRAYENAVEAGKGWFGICAKPLAYGCYSIFGQGHQVVLWQQSIAEGASNYYCYNVDVDTEKPKYTAQTYMTISSAIWDDLRNTMKCVKTEQNKLTVGSSVNWRAEKCTYANFVCQ